MATSAWAYNETDLLKLEAINQCPGWDLSGANLTGLTAGGPSLGTASVIRTNAQTISENITIGSTTNGMSAGPITIADSYTVTVNGNWSIV